MERIEEFIREVMVTNKISLRSIEKSTGISKSALHRYLHGELEKIPLGDFEKLCRFLNLDPAETLGWVVRDDDGVEEEIKRRMDALSPDQRGQWLTFADYMIATREK